MAMFIVVAALLAFLVACGVVALVVAVFCWAVVASVDGMEKEKEKE